MIKRTLSVMLLALSYVVAFPSSAASPQSAAQKHMEALMTLDNRLIARTMFFPFVHINPDGTKNLIQSKADLPDMTGLPFRTELTNVSVVRRKSNIAVLYVEFQRYDLDGKATVGGSAFWGLTKSGDVWLVSWRQFLGTSNDA